MISEPKTAIVGNDELYIEAGSTINLTCTIQTGPTAETLIYWNYNGKVRIMLFTQREKCITLHIIQIGKLSW